MTLDELIVQLENLKLIHGGSCEVEISDSSGYDYPIMDVFVKPTNIGTNLIILE